MASTRSGSVPSPAGNNGEAGLEALALAKVADLQRQPTRLPPWRVLERWSAQSTPSLPFSSPSTLPLSEVPSRNPSGPSERFWVGAAGTQVPEQPKQPYRSYEPKMFSGCDPKPMKASAFLPTIDPLLPNTVNGKRKSLVGSSSHLGAQAVHEYQFLPEQPSDIYERGSQSRYYDTPAEASNPSLASLSTGSRFLHGVEQAPSYSVHGHLYGSSHLAQHGRPPIPSGSTDHEGALSNINVSPAPIHGQFGIPQVARFETHFASSERMGYHDEDTYRVDRKRKHNEEAKTAREVEAHEKRIRKELEKQELLNKKREEQMRRETERHDRERRKEEERLMREMQREEERFQKEQRREHKHMEKFMQKHKPNIFSYVSVFLLCVLAVRRKLCCFKIR